ncbi:MAG: hypothetical protein ACN6O6_15975 [Pseudomonas sp.]|uniref:hypothetical protein n=1 Tax=Pseudomonas sp. TaxID=306 RepID=UPI003D11B03B
MNHNVYPSQICVHAADLARAKRVYLTDEERKVFDHFAEIGYVNFHDDRHTTSSRTLCTCRHPALFEFYFYYRWLPENLHNFKVPRRQQDMATGT